MRVGYETRFKSVDNASNLASRTTGVRLPEDIDMLIRSIPVAERSAWLRRIITEGAIRELRKT